MANQEMDVMSPFGVQLIGIGAFGGRSGMVINFQQSLAVMQKMKILSQFQSQHVAKFTRGIISCYN